LFGDNNGCSAFTRCDFGPCQCNLDQCNWCGICREHGTTKNEGETCNKNTKEARDAKAADDKLYHPDIPAENGTDLKKESMVPQKAYEVADFLSVPDCEFDSHEKNHGPRKLTGGRVFISRIIICNKCINF